MPSLRRALAVAALLLAAACGGKLAHRQEGVIRGRAPLDAAVSRLSIEVDYGSITVLADDSEPTAVAFEGSTLRAADTAEQLQALAALDLTLHAATDGSVLRLRPPALPAEVDPANARLVVRGVIRCPSRLQVTIRSGLGSLKVDRIAADVDLRTAQGEIMVSACRGLAQAHTGSGDVMVDRHQGALVLEAPGGSARAFLMQLADGGVRATVRSALEIHVPRATGFSVQGRTERGRCHNTFGVPIVVDGVVATMQGAANGGGPILDLRSSAGAVTVAASD